MLGEERDLPICSLPGKRTIRVFYTLYEDKPQSHRLEFRKGKRTVFGIFLPRHRQDRSDLVSAVEGRAGTDATFGFWARLLLRLVGGTLIAGRELFPGPRGELHTSWGDSHYGNRYLLAYCRRGTQEWVVFVRSRHSTQSGSHRSAARSQFNWLKLTRDQFTTFGNHLRAFMKSDAFTQVEKQVGDATEHKEGKHTTQ
jgi:hypothetical protein